MPSRRMAVAANSKSVFGLFHLGRVARCDCAEANDKRVCNRWIVRFFVALTRDTRARRIAAIASAPTFPGLQTNGLLVLFEINRRK
jgi:hypothetical protein